MINPIVDPLNCKGLKRALLLLLGVFLQLSVLEVAGKERDSVVCHCTINNPNPGFPGHQSGDCVDGKIKCPGQKCLTWSVFKDGLPTFKWCAPTDAETHCRSTYTTTTTTTTTTESTPDPLLPSPETSTTTTVPPEDEQNYCVCEGDLCNNRECCDCKGSTENKCPPIIVTSSTTPVPPPGSVDCHCQGLEDCRNGRISCPSGRCATSTSYYDGQTTKHCENRKEVCVKTGLGIHAMSICTCSSELCNSNKCCACEGDECHNGGDPAPSGPNGPGAQSHSSFSGSSLVLTSGLALLIVGHSLNCN